MWHCPFEMLALGAFPGVTTRFNRVQQADRKRFNRNHLESTNFNSFNKAWNLVRNHGVERGPFALRPIS